MNRRIALTSTPAVQAFFIQIVACLLVAVMLMLLKRYGGIELGIGIAAAMQGLVAATITYFRRLSPWWVPLQLVLPPLAISILILGLPPWVYLAIFLVLLGLYWATLFSRVPLYLSSASMRQCVADLLPDDRSVDFVDIGSGLGGVVLYLARFRPDSRFTGIELAPVPWLISRIRARLQRSHGRFILGDYNRLDLSNYDVVFAYLSPLAMGPLWAKARTEMRPGSLLLSCEFPILGVEPDIVMHPKPGHAVLYGWRIAG